MEMFIAMIHRHREDALDVVAQRIIEQVGETRFRTRGGQKQVTVSAGATPARPKDSCRELVGRAEHLLDLARSVKPGTLRSR
jgi:GGDEF domain-containing protein